MGTQCHTVRHGDGHEPDGELGAACLPSSSGAIRDACGHGWLLRRHVWFICRVVHHRNDRENFHDGKRKLQEVAGGLRVVAEASLHSRTGASLGFCYARTG